MAKLGSYKTNQVIGFIQNKLKIGLSGKKEPKGWYYLDGQKRVRVTVSKEHGSTTLKKGTTKGIARQLMVTNIEFDALYNCPMSGTDYEAKIRRLIKERVL